MCALFSQFWAFRQKQRGILSEVVRLHEADEIKVRNAKTLRRLERFHSLRDLYDSSCKLHVHQTQACNLGVPLSICESSCKHIWVSLVNFCSTVPGLPVSFAELNCERSPNLLGKAEATLSRWNVQRGSESRLPQAMLPASLNTRNLCWKKAIYLRYYIYRMKMNK